MKNLFFLLIFILVSCVKTTYTEQIVTATGISDEVVLITDAIYKGEILIRYNCVETKSDSLTEVRKGSIYYCSVWKINDSVKRAQYDLVERYRLAYIDKIRPYNPEVLK